MSEFKVFDKKDPLPFITSMLSFYGKGFMFILFKRLVSFKLCLSLAGDVQCLSDADMQLHTPALLI